MSRERKGIVRRIAWIVASRDMHLIFMLIPVVSIVLMVPELSFIWLGFWLLVSQVYISVHVYEDRKMGHNWVDYLVVNEILALILPAIAVCVAYWLGPFRPRS